MASEKEKNVKCPELQGKRQKTLLYFLRVTLHHQLVDNFSFIEPPII
jgi:hypothetical protein